MLVEKSLAMMFVKRVSQTFCPNINQLICGVDMHNGNTTVSGSGSAGRERQRIRELGEKQGGATAVAGRGGEKRGTGRVGGCRAERGAFTKAGAEGAER